MDYYRRLWHEIHTRAAQVRTTHDHSQFCTWMRRTAQELPCAKCRHHATKYIHDNPPEQSPNVFIWTWEFHNAVNGRLGKPIMPYSTAAAMYLH